MTIEAEYPLLANVPSGGPLEAQRGQVASQAQSALVEIARLRKRVDELQAQRTRETAEDEERVEGRPVTRAYLEPTLDQFEAALSTLGGLIAVVNSKLDTLLERIPE